MQGNRELLTQIERRQLSPHEPGNLQINPVLSQISNPYSRNLSPTLLTRYPLANQFHPAERRDVAMDLSREATSLGLGGGGDPRVDFVTVMSHLQVDATAVSPGMPAGEGDG